MYLLFFDKKDLTNGVDGCIHCAMNANEISPKANVRLNRIKIVSRVLKVLFLLSFVCLGYLGHFLPFVHRTPDGFWRVVWGTYAKFSEVPLAAKLIVALGVGVLLASIITCYQLLSLYEKGVIFSARNVQLLGRIGCLAVGYGLLGACGPALMSAWNHWIGVETFLSVNSFLLGIYGFLTSPWIIGGLFLIVISFIMDEGRKIQEEQELTV
jgi:hypothetical protein